MLAFCTFVAFAAVSGVIGYPTGPPIDSDPSLCTSMLPEHNYTAQTGASPFVITVNTADCYKEGLAISVSAKLKADSNSYYEGLMMEARPVGVSNDAQGTWSVLQENQAQFKTWKCFNKANSAVAHKQKFHYECRTFTWTAPASYQNDIQFVATFVHETEKFWLNIMSSTIKYSSSCAIDSSIQKCPLPPPKTTPKPSSAGMPALHATAILTSILLLLITH